jgi:hypothetical protein
MNKLEEAVKNSFSISETLRYLNLKVTGNSWRIMKRKIIENKLDTSHFGSRKHLKSNTKKHFNEFLIIRPKESGRLKTSILRRAMIEFGIKLICNECKVSNTWNNKPIVLEIDHINENPYDNRPENLQFLCPNCHSQK